MNIFKSLIKSCLSHEVLKVIFNKAVKIPGILQYRQYHVLILSQDGKLQHLLKRREQKPGNRAKQ